MNYPSVYFALSLSLAGAQLANAQIAVEDDFESGNFSSAWNQVQGASIEDSGGARSSSRYAKLAAYNQGYGVLAADFTVVALEGAKDFFIDCYFRVRNTSERQFNLNVAISGTATVNLRYQEAQGGWAVYGARWHPVTDLGHVSPGQWHRLRVSGLDWGTASAHYNLFVSDAGGTNFTRSATNLTLFHDGNPQASPARTFRLTTQYGNNPGFDVDEVIAGVTAIPPPETNAILNISGTYPHLTVYSGSGEIGIGAVAPWADRLWFITYPPHNPSGSADKLWTVDTNLTLEARPESVGGTHANRFIHRESQQLNLGPYFIDANRTVRAIAPGVMPGRLTGSARHLTDPANKLYIASMEEGLYEVDVNTLSVTELYQDTHNSGGIRANHPGAHGKGLYSSQGRVVYSNNGAGGSLRSWDGTNWTTVESEKFTEVTGPGGMGGNPPEQDRLWALGWDTRSVILKLLEEGVWRAYRLPKGSYSHDADHGWFTEWPRIREIVEGKMLMHMHGLFYYFPKTFSVANAAGIDPICAYLKMPVDYCWWNGQLVIGRDDASTTGGNQWAGQSHSALWFGQLDDLKQWGAPAGFGGPWKDDAVIGNTPSDPFFVSGFVRRILHLKQASPETVNFALQSEANSAGEWTTLRNYSVPPNGYIWQLLPPGFKADWIRLVPDRNATGVTAYFHLGNPQTPAEPELFSGIADVDLATAYSDGIIRPASGNARTLQFAANRYSANDGPAEAAYYEIGGALQLRRQTNAAAENTLRATYGLENAEISVDSASVIVTEGANRFRLPKNHSAYDTAFACGWPRGKREVVTERDLFQAHGTFYELPKSASGGFRKLRPVTTHNKHISDFASWRGLFVMAGVAANVATGEHVIRSQDGQVALWFGNVDDLWRMGQPAGRGGPWNNATVAANTASDPYLMYGYEGKILELSHHAEQPVTFTIEVDFAADNTWSEYARLTVQPGETLRHIFPNGYSAHWVRLKTDAGATVTATFTYGPTTPELGALTPLPDGNVRLTSTGLQNQTYARRASENPASARQNWHSLAAGSFGPAPVTYDDRSATNSPRRFYVCLPALDVSC